MIGLKEESIELVHRYGGKRYMCVGLRACNAAVLWDWGRYPLWIESARRCVKYHVYWIKILAMPDSRYVKSVISCKKVQVGKDQEKAQLTILVI